MPGRTDAFLILRSTPRESEVCVSKDGGILSASARAHQSRVYPRLASLMRKSATADLRETHASRAPRGEGAAEGVAADAAGNIYGAEVGPKRMMKYVKK
jgi:hypothetical protein